MVASPTPKVTPLRTLLLRLFGVFTLLLVLPFLKLAPAYESFAYLAFHWVALATSWNILSGYAGYFSFGHGAFFGIGMYTTAVLAGRFDWPFLATLPFAALVACAFALALGAVAFRVRSVRGELFALLTLAASFVVATIVLNTPIDGGPGVVLSGVAMPQLAPTPSGSFYLLAWGAALLAVVAALVVQHARLGLALLAIHDDEDVAEVLGVPTYRAKLLALGLSSALAGLVGGIHAMFVSYVTVGDTFGVTLPLTVVLMAVLGGTRHWAGPAVGAAGITVLLYSFTSGDSALVGKVVMGAVLIAVILFMPEGVMGRWIARKRGDDPTPVEAVPVAAEPAAPAQTLSPGAAPLLVTRQLAKSFAGVKALRGVDVQVHPGEILGLVGPNGSGKSTFINVVSGHYLASDGEVTFEGQRMEALPAHRVANSGIARTYQIPRPFEHLSVLRNVALPAMFGVARLGREAAETQARQWLAFTGLAGREDVLPAALNLHQRKFLELARALAAKPRLLMLDEVLSGLTPAEIDAAVALIRRIRAQGTAIVLVEHVMRAVMALADRIVVFDQGQVLAEGAPQEVMARPEVVAAYLGQAPDDHTLPDGITMGAAHA